MTAMKHSVDAATRRYPVDTSVTLRTYQDEVTREIGLAKDAAHGSG